MNPAAAELVIAAIILAHPNQLPEQKIEVKLYPATHITQKKSAALQSKISGKAPHTQPMRKYSNQQQRNRSGK
ncbi:MAG: hypothetical protein NTX86_00320 [Candidatus Dependentiae bacterium]|nr:hypothetical protein [Candidatus Dependentiae bacterium]